MCISSQLWLVPSSWWLAQLFWAGIHVGDGQRQWSGPLVSESLVTFASIPLKQSHRGCDLAKVTQLGMHTQGVSQACWCICILILPKASNHIALGNWVSPQHTPHTHTRAYVHTHARTPTENSLRRADSPDATLRAAYDLRLCHGKRAANLQYPKRLFK